MSLKENIATLRLFKGYILKTEEYLGEEKNIIRNGVFFKDFQ